MVNRSTIPSTGLFLALIGIFFLGGCASAPPPPPPVPVAPVKKDALDLFTGAKLKGPGPHRIQSNPVGIEDVRLLVKVLRTSSTTMSHIDGTTEKETKVRLALTRGEQNKVVWVDVGETTTVLGVRITVKDAGESYVDSRQDWLPFVIMTAN